MNKIYFLISAMLLGTTLNTLSMDDMGRAFCYFMHGVEPSCHVVQDMESHGCICKKRIGHVSHFVNDGHECYCTQLSSDDWLVARKDITGMSKGTIVCLRYFKAIAEVDWISLPVDKSIFSMLQERHMLISAPHMF